MLAVNEIRTARRRRPLLVEVQEEEQEEAVAVLAEEVALEAAEEEEARAMEDLVPAVQVVTLRQADKVAEAPLASVVPAGMESTLQVAVLADR